MPRDSRVYLEDILDAIVRIRRYVGAEPFETFASDERTVDADVVTNKLPALEARVRDMLKR